LRWRINERWLLTFSYMLLRYLERDVRTSETSPPTNVRGSGWAHMPGLEIEAAF